jgi:hypothetical protein
MPLHICSISLIIEGQEEQEENYHAKANFVGLVTTVKNWDRAMLCNLALSLADLLEY